MENEKTLVIERDHGTHKSKYTFTKTDYFCMHCGEKEVWDDDCDDYYRGTNWVCFECGSTWDNPGSVRECDWFDQIKEELKDKI